MTFGSHTWIIALALVIPVLVLFFVLTEQRVWKRLSYFAGNRILRQLTANYSPFLRNTKAALVITVVVLGCLALSRPQAGHTYREEKRRGIDFIIALDVSRSMLAEDIKPNRLERAKLAIHDLLLQTEGDRVGLLAFAGSAFLQCPLTLDYDAFRQTLDSVDTGLLATQGTDVAGAILEAQGSFAEGDNQKILVMITDGEDLEAEGVLEARKVGEEGIVIYTVGVGSAEGELIPVRNSDGSQDWLRDAQGELVQTRLDETVLRQIAVATNGAYVPLGPAGQGLNYVYEHGLSLVPEEEREAHMSKVPVERYQWPLAIAVGCLLLEMLLGTRRLGKGFRASRGAVSNLILFGLGLCLLPWDLSAFTFGGGKSHYKNGDYEKAKAIFQEDAEDDPDSAIHQYNLGAAQFQLGAFENSTNALDKALELEKDNPEFQRDIYASRGLVRFQQGMLEDDAAKTIELWTQGLLDYATALNLHDMEDERHAELQESHDKLEQQLRDYTYEHGVNQYREGKFDTAAEAFDDALKVAAKDRRDEIFYNQGNARFRLGQEQLQSSPQETIKSWEQALKDYDQAIEAREGEPFEKAVKNRDLVQQRLEELKQQQPQNQDSDKQDGDSDQDQKESQNNDSNSEQSESQNQDSQQNQANDSQESDNGQASQSDSEADQEEESANQKQGENGDDDEENSQAQSSHAKNGDQSDGEDAKPIPGRMTQEQAMQLLEVLRDYERKLPLGNLERIRRKDDKDGREGRNW